ncbi:MAG: hypothetical protein NXI12_15515 [Alphaproteobacteria bacterium]|nr:hypothetical protein [Alphaproteobacteria bacterium]
MAYEASRDAGVASKLRCDEGSVARASRAFAIFGVHLQWSVQLVHGGLQDSELLEDYRTASAQDTQTTGAIMAALHGLLTS